MRVAFGALHFNPHHPMADVFDFFNCIHLHHIKKAGPAGAAIEFGGGAEKGRIAARTMITAKSFGIPILTREGAFGAAHPAHIILNRR